MTSDPKVLGRRLRQVRAANNFTQQQMAEKMGLDTPIISRIENGQRKVSAVELHKWATFCGSTSDAILNGDPVVVKAAS